MEVTQSFDIAIKSIVHDYGVTFTDDFAASLRGVLQEGDYIIVDRKIVELYDKEISPILAVTNHIVIDATEQQKSYQGVEPLINTLIEGGYRKNHRLIAVGGGITQDTTAFMASIMYRGVDWIFFPTTLLAQCDSCIGSKTSINFGEYKNQIGGFYPPNRIFIDPRFLDTLTEGEMKSGLGEMLHYYVVAGEEDFKFFRDNFKAAFTDKQVLAKLISRSLEIKKSYIERDEFDRGPRQVFNYGHSFGHAIEALTHFRVPHGVAVSYGMDMANFVSVKLGLIPERVRDEIREVVVNFWPGFEITELDVDTFIHALSKDKKNIGKKLGLILNKGYGQIFKNVMDNDDTFHAWMVEYFQNELKF